MVSEVWKKTQDYLKTSLPPSDYELWISPLKPRSLENGLFTVEVPNRFHADWLEKNVKKRVLSFLRPEETGVMELDFIWSELASPKGAAGSWHLRPETGFTATVRPGQAACFNPKYIFDRFVVGPTNRFAYASCLAVSENPGKQFNPLFIYGNSGLGKTHLLHAIGHSTLKNNPQLTVAYVNAESLVNEYLNALKNKDMDNYRERYRKVGCLLIDDVQFLIGKEHSEQEFFHTFNSLFDLNRQIVLTSDRAPKDLQPLETRLVSRFEWGVVADVKPPDFETRLAILRKKCEFEGVALADEVLQRLAQSVRSNIRVLEGSLNSLIAYCCLTGSPASFDVVDQILKQLKEEIPESHALSPSIAKIQEVVAKHYHVDAADLKDKGRSASKVLPRQVAIYLSRTLTGKSLEEIGRAFGGKDHSTVVHAVSKISGLARTDPYLSQFINKLEEEIRKTNDF
ncbi:MAG: chromosomal replication initiator protein DnaA [Elusimicrobia bacterium]|nr:chromosomal replication initiator protein DnaA [Elusimicrobiota bacterium]